MRSIFNLNFAFRLFIYTAMGVFTILENPLGMADASDRAFQRAHNEFTAPFYDTSAQDDSLVVLLNNSSMKYLYSNGITGANSWPLLYSDHVLILEKILEYQPRAIFVDIYFKDRRSTDPSFDEFELLLEEAKDRRVPIYFAQGYPDEVLSDVQLALDRDGGLLVNGWTNYRERYALKPDGENSVALELYRLACLGSQAPYASCAQDGLNIDDVGPEEAIAVDWSSKAGRNLFPERVQLDCEESVLDLLGRSESVGLQRGLDYLWTTLTSAKNVLFGSGDYPCLYNNTLPAETLVSIVKRGSDSEMAQLKAEIEDKIIFYAVDIGALTDEFDSPVHGLVPGVYRHSMALDNLISYGDQVKYKKTDLLDVGDSIVWGIMCFIVLGLKENAFGQRFGDTAQFGWPKLALLGALPLLVWVVFSDFLMGPIAWLTFSGEPSRLNYESVNLLGYMTLMIMLIELVKSEFAAGIIDRLYAVMRWLGKLPGVGWVLERIKVRRSTSNDRDLV